MRGFFMFSERTLFERLSKPRTQGLRTVSENYSAITKSIIHSIQNLLNSRIGHAPAQMDYGIPEPSEITRAYPNGLGDMQRAIRASLEKYEPRLTSINVMHVETAEEEMSLRFQITAQLATSKERIPVCFDTLVRGSGEIQVKS